MKNLLISTALLTATSTMAFADDHKFMAEADPMAIQASEFIGQRIYTTSTEVNTEGYEGVQQDWEDIGEVHDIVLSRDGNIQSVLVDIGGFLGIGERQVAVDMDALKMVSDSATAEDDADYFLVMQAEVAELENAPAYEHTAMNDLGNRAEQAADNTATAVENTAEDLENSAQAAADNVGEAMNDATAEVKETTAEVKSEMGEMQREGFETVQSDKLTAEMLTGARAYDAKDEWMGEVSDLVMNDKGEITHAIVDVGGFLGIGEKPVKLDLNQIEVLHETGGDEVRVYLPMTEDKLKGMDAYEG